MGTLQLRKLACVGALLGAAVCCAGPAAAQNASGAADAAKLAEARADLDAGKAQEAIALLQGLLAAEPGYGEGHFLLGFALLREVQVHAADAADLTHAARHESFVALREKNARASLAQFTEGARFARPGAFDLKIVALDYVLLGDEPDADKWLTQSLAWDPSDEQGWFYEGRIRYKQAHYPGAAQAFEHALQLNARDIKAEDNLGLSYEGMGETAEAVEALETAVGWMASAHSTDDAPLVDLGGVLVDHHREAEAVGYLRQATAMAPQDLRAREKLAAAYRGLQRWPEAQKELEAAVAMAPDDPSLHFMLGQVYRRTGEPAKATAEMQRSAALEAKDESAARATSSQ